MRGFIGLGSNRGEGSRQLTEALSRMQATPGIVVLRRAGYYRTAPWGDTRQADFTNSVAEIATTLEPEALLQALQRIEAEMGRVRTDRRWGPRVIDLDLLLLEERSIDLPDLTVPHPRMHQRAFVLIPLLELEPEAALPGHGRAQALLDALPAAERQSVVRLPPSAAAGHGIDSPRHRQYDRNHSDRSQITDFSAQEKTDPRKAK